MMTLYVYSYFAVLMRAMKPETLNLAIMKNWALFEEGYVHTDGLSKKDAEEMLERYIRIFPDLEFYIQQI